MDKQVSVGQKATTPNCIVAFLVVDAATRCVGVQSESTVRCRRYVRELGNSFQLPRFEVREPEP